MIALELPEPPSANRWWRNVNGRMITSKEARDYKEDVAKRLTARRVRSYPRDVEVRVTVRWYRGRRSGDLDKRLGVLLDALQGSAFVSDAQVVEIHATRHDRPGDAGVFVRVEAARDAVHQEDLLDPSRLSSDARVTTGAAR